MENFFSYASKLIFAFLLQVYVFSIQQNSTQSTLNEMIEKEKSKGHFKIVIENLQEPIIIFSGKKLNNVNKMFLD